MERAIGFAVLDYMNPHGSYRARRLYNSYVGWCDRAAASPPAAPRFRFSKIKAPSRRPRPQTKKGS